MTMTLDDVRRYLAPGSGSRLDESAVPHLIALADGPDPALAVRATYALGVVPTAEAGASLTRLATHRDPKVRRAAACSARSFDGRVHEPVLRRLLLDTDAWVVRAAADVVPDRVSPRRRALEEQVSSEVHPALRQLALSAIRRSGR